jgi:hypothetical protein
MFVTENQRIFILHVTPHSTKDLWWLHSETMYSCNAESSHRGALYWYTSVSLEEVPICVHESTWVRYDVVTPHFAHCMHNWIRNHFLDGWNRYRGPITWYPHSSHPASLRDSSKISLLLYLHALMCDLNSFLILLTGQWKLLLSLYGGFILFDMFFTEYLFCVSVLCFRGSRSVGIVRLRTQATEFSLLLVFVYSVFYSPHFHTVFFSPSWVIFLYHPIIALSSSFSKSAKDHLNCICLNIYKCK